MHLDFVMATATYVCPFQGLVEIRFYIPQDKEGESEENPAAAFHQRVMEKADVTSGTGGGLVVFPNTPVLTPRYRAFLLFFSLFFTVIIFTVGADMTLKYSLPSFGCMARPMTTSSRSTAFTIYLNFLNLTTDTCASLYVFVSLGF